MQMDHGTIYSRSLLIRICTNLLLFWPCLVAFLMRSHELSHELSK
eukprot:SAG11_NODE_1031_length_6111_cov_2.587159_5_plen_45_part_00